MAHADLAAIGGTTILFPDRNVIMFFCLNWRMGAQISSTGTRSSGALQWIDKYDRVPLMLFRQWPQGEKSNDRLYVQICIIIYAYTLIMLH